MKKTINLLAFLGLLMFTACKTSAQVVVVRSRPARPTVVVARPSAPSPRHVWIEEEWVPQGRSYVWHGGYWATPPRPRAVYVKGHWRHSRAGWVWVPGRWR